MQKHHTWPPVIHWHRIGLVTLGVTFAVGMAGLLTDLTHCIVITTSLGASSFILFGFPDSAFAQPRNFIGGQLLTALIGLAFLHVFGNPWWAVAIATGTAVAAMMLTDTIHPPAASNPFIVSSLHAGWSYVVFPDFSGGLLILAMAFLYHRLTRKSYPLYWI